MMHSSCKAFSLPVTSNNHNLEQLKDMKQVVDYEAFIKLDSLQITAEPQTISIIGRSWEYRGEGNSNIVIALQDEMSVVRLSKITIGDLTSDDSWNVQRKKIEREVIYANYIFGRIIGKDYVGQVKIIEVNPFEFKELNQLLKSKRPLNRLHKELGLPFGTLRDDFTRINNSQVDYCIEIKPKQGWWSKSLMGEPTTLCTFCLNQFLKLKIGKITCHSNYCPLDLFSGNAVRMIQSVLSLMEHPQNNFRIFRNGHLVYGEHNSGPESLQIILQEWFANKSKFQKGLNTEQMVLGNAVYMICLALLTPPKSFDSHTHLELLTEIKDTLEKLQRKTSLSVDLSLLSLTNKEKCNESSNNLPDGSILSQILAAQELGKWSGEMAYKLYSKICPCHNGRNNAECPAKKCGKEDKWLDQIENYTNDLTELECLCIEHYLLAATAKDCSIMIAFSEHVEQTKAIENPNKRYKLDPTVSKVPTSNTGEIQDLYGNKHIIKVGVADLDPKPVTSIPRHYYRDLGMISAFLASKSNISV